MIAYRDSAKDVREVAMDPWTAIPTASEETRRVIYDRPIRFGPLALAALLALPAASDAARERAPQQVTIGDRTLVLNGTGTRSKLGISIYRAALYVEAKSSDPAMLLAPDRSRRMSLHVVRDVPREPMEKATRWTFERNAGERMSSLQARLDAFVALLVDLHPGDRFEMTFVPGVGTTVAVRGAEVGVIAGADFAEVLFSIWLGERPVQESLKRDLLGLPSTRAPSRGSP